MLMESTIESPLCCIFTSSVLISLWACLSLYLQTPPLDLLAFLCSSVTSSGSLSSCPSNNFSSYPVKKLYLKVKFLSHIYFKHITLHQFRFSFKTNTYFDEPLERLDYENIEFQTNTPPQILLIMFSTRNFENQLSNISCRKSF
ncbi:hypothetical protein Hanom_Chr01g00043491 [Helianthus anomalus]